jgi:phage major head subunit gpT-like protein
MYNSPNALMKGIKTNFFKLMETQRDPMWKDSINEVTSDSNKETYFLPMTIGGIKEWIDSISYTDMEDKALEVVNKDWDEGVLVDRNTLSDSKKTLGGNLEMWIKSITAHVKDYPDDLVQMMLEANGNAFDGTAFFATSRPNIDTGSNTINNLYTGTATSATAYTIAQLTEDYAGAKAAILGFKDKNNKAFNKGAKLELWVPAHFEDIANQLLSDRARRIYNGTAEIDNIYAATAEVKVNYNQAATDGDLYLVNKAATYKPFIMQNREGVKWTKVDDPEQKKLKYFYTFRLGYSLFNPMAIVKINN